MKYLLHVAVMGLALVACSEKPPEKAATSVAVLAPAYIKASTTRPSVIQSTVNLPNSCRLEGVNGKPAKDASITDKAKVGLGGWVGNVPAGTSPKIVFVELEGPSKLYVQASHGIKRPDVADYFKKPGLAETGWFVLVDLSEAPGGSYQVRIIQVEGESSLVCDSKDSIVIK